VALQKAQDAVGTAIEVLLSTVPVTVNHKPVHKGKKHMSAAARKKISDAAKARWAKIREGKK